MGLPPPDPYHGGGQCCHMDGGPKIGPVRGQGWPPLGSACTGQCRRICTTPDQHQRHQHPSVTTAVWQRPAATVTAFLPTSGGCAGLAVQLECVGDEGIETTECVVGGHAVRAGKRVELGRRCGALHGRFAREPVLSGEFPAGPAGKPAERGGAPMPACPAPSRPFAALL